MEGAPLDWCASKFLQACELCGSLAWVFSMWPGFTLNNWPLSKAYAPLLCSALLPEEITWLSPPSTPAPADKAPLCNIPARCVSPLKPDIQHILVWKHSVAGRSTDNICYCLEVVKGDSTSWSRLEFTLWLALPITFAAVLLKWLLRRLPGWRSRLQSCCFVWLMEATHRWLC